MNGINFKRVIVGGLVTGLIINVGETILNAFVIGGLYQDALTTYGVAESPDSVVLFAVYGFLLGIVTMFVYAGFRPRFGAGPRAAVLAGLAVWFVYSGSFADFQLAIPLFPTAVPLTNLGWGLVEVPLATVAGAALYREP